MRLSPVMAGIVGFTNPGFPRPTDLNHFLSEEVHEYDIGKRRLIP